MKILKSVGGALAGGVLGFGIQAAEALYTGGCMFCSPQVPTAVGMLAGGGLTAFLGKGK